MKPRQFPPWQVLLAVQIGAFAAFVLRYPAMAASPVDGTTLGLWLQPFYLVGLGALYEVVRSRSRGKVLAGLKNVGALLVFSASGYILVQAAWVFWEHTRRHAAQESLIWAAVFLVSFLAPRAIVRMADKIAPGPTYPGESEWPELGAGETGRGDGSPEKPITSIRQTATQSMSSPLGVGETQEPPPEASNALIQRLGGVKDDGRGGYTGTGDVGRDRSGSQGVPDVATYAYGRSSGRGGEDDFVDFPTGRQPRPHQVDQPTPATETSGARRLTTPGTTETTQPHKGGNSRRSRPLAGPDLVRIWTDYVASSDGDFRLADFRQCLKEAGYDNEVVDGTDWGEEDTLLAVRSDLERDSFMLVPNPNRSVEAVSTWFDAPPNTSRSANAERLKIAAKWRGQPTTGELEARGRLG